MELAVQPPTQARSRETFGAILSATEELLQSRSFEEIGVADIIRSAAVSTGSFYARFASKDALLPVLYQRYEHQLTERSERLVREISAAVTLLDACTAIVRALAATFENNLNLMRAMTSLARAEPSAARPPSSERRQIHHDIENAMLRFRGGAASEAVRQAVGAAQFMAVCMLREAILFPNAPFASATGVREQIEPMVARMMTRYIEGECSA
jgi:AcrR family transcriptional regulator